MQVLQAGQHKLIYLEVEPDMVTSIARQAGFDTKARDGQRSMTLDLSFPGRHSPLLLFDFLNALAKTGVAVCGGGVVQPLAGRTEPVVTPN